MQSITKLKPGTRGVVDSDPRFLSRVTAILDRAAASVDADTILVISGGTAAQRGAHDELMAQGGIYRDFVRVRKSSRLRSRRKAAGL
jgi:hypothetical protein